MGLRSWVLLTLLAAGPVWAAPTSKPVRIQKFYFDKPDLIQGKIPGIDYMWIQARRKSKHKSLIKLRQHWKKKIQESVEQL